MSYEVGRDILLKRMESPVPPPLNLGEIPPPVADDRLDRSPLSWALVVVIFAFYVMIGLLPGPKAIKNQDKYFQEETTIHIEMIQRSLLTEARTSGAATSKKATIPDDTFDKLESKKLSDLRADRLLIAARHEQGDETRPQDVDILAKSKDDADKAFLTIYQSKKLTAEDAESLSKRMPDSEFAYRLAKVHAYELAGDSSAREKFAPVWKALVLGAFGGCAVIGVFLGIVLWIIYLDGRKHGKFMPLGHPADPVSPAMGDRLAYRAGVMLATFILLQFMVAAYLKGQSEPTLMIVVFSAMFLAVLLIHKIPALGMRIPLSRVGVTKNNLTKDLLWGVGGYVASLPIIVVAALIGSFLTRFFGQPSHPIDQLIEGGSISAYTVFAIFFSGAIIAPFWEEIMFRGSLLPALSSAFKKPVWGIVLSSFLFAAIHPQGPPLWLALGSIGAMNCILAYQTKSLIPCMILHLLNNSIVLCFTLLVS